MILSENTRGSRLRAVYMSSQNSPGRSLPKPYGDSKLLGGGVRKDITFVGDEEVFEALG